MDRIIIKPRLYRLAKCRRNINYSYMIGYLS
jgi:hypothetical protein